MKISYFLPSKVVTNEELIEKFPNKNAQQIENKIGFIERRKAGEHEFVSDLATSAAKNLFAEYGINISEIDFLILCSQTPDFNIPSTSSIVQDKLKLNKQIGCLDIIQGCTGFIYSLAVSKALVTSKLAKNILLITSETYSKHISSTDFGNNAIFGDGAAAILFTQENKFNVGEFVFGNDGGGAFDLFSNKNSFNKNNAIDVKDALYMNGPEIFNFTINIIEKLFIDILDKNGCQKEEIDYFVFHQANSFILKHLNKILDVPNEKMIFNSTRFGNTVSSSIPISLKTMMIDGFDLRDKSIMLIGFGVGLSWGGTIIKF